MRYAKRIVLSLVALSAVALAGWALASPDSGGVSAVTELATSMPDAGPAACSTVEAPELFPVMGKGKPPKLACCDPALEPGQNGNPFCFEGHSCCTDGTWRCNNPDATPSCDLGEVCEAGCGSRGDSCSGGSECCSGSCKGGRCK